jgi:hypothetical protein
VILMKEFINQVLSLRKERQRNLAAWFDPVKQGAALRRVEEEVRLFVVQDSQILSATCHATLHCEQVKRRLVEVAIVARGDVFPTFAAFQEVLLKVTFPSHRLLM